MKSFLYAGAVLMIGASIYGFVDYKKTSHDKKFKTLYQEEKKEQPVVNERAEVPVVLQKEETEINDVKKEMPVEKKITKKNMEEIDNTPAENLKNNTDEVFTKRKVKKEKKLNYKLFSRAPLREYEEEPVIPVPKVKYLKTEEAKSVNQ